MGFWLLMLIAVLHAAAAGCAAADGKGWFAFMLFAFAMGDMAMAFIATQK